MCGIVGYVGDQSALQVVLDGLRRLEYRGYDSAGVAILTEGELRLAKKAGKLTNLEKALQEEQGRFDGRTGIGHTRWATHGGPTDRTAHPHVSHDGVSPSSTTASSKTLPACAPRWSPPASSSPATPTPSAWHTCSRWNSPRPAT